MALCLLAAGAVAGGDASARTFGLVTGGLVLSSALAVERTVPGVAAWRHFGDPAALAFPLVHLARNMAWVAAVVVWTVRRLLRRPLKPEHSMMPRAAADDCHHRVLTLIPAHNEAASLPAVVAELRQCRRTSTSSSWTMVLPIIRTGCCASWESNGFTGPNGAVSAARCAQACATPRGRGTTLSYGSMPMASTTSKTWSVCWRRSWQDGGLRARVAFRRRPIAPAVPVQSSGRLERCPVDDDETHRDRSDVRVLGVGPRAVALLAEHHPAGYPKPSCTCFSAATPFV